MIYALLTFLLLFALNTTASAEPLQCDGQVVADQSELEKTLPFFRPDVSDDFTGYLGHFQVVDSNGEALKRYDERQLLNRALSYSASQCAPAQIVFPDLQIVIEYYEEGVLNGRSRLVNGGKILTQFTQFSPDGAVQAEYGYKNRLIHGTARFYHSNGSLNYTLDYENGKRKVI